MSSVRTSPSFRAMVDEYKARVIDPTYHPLTPVETLKARVTATYLLKSGTPEEVQKAKGFILKTSTNAEDLFRLTHLALQVSFWEALTIYAHDENSCYYSLRFHRLHGKFFREYHADYLTEESKCTFTKQEPLSVEKFEPHQQVAPGSHSLLAAPRPDAKPTAETPLLQLRSKL